MKKQFEKSQEIFETWKDSQRDEDESGSFGRCNWTMEDDRFRIECWTTDKYGLRIYQIYSWGNGFQEWEPTN